MVRRSCASSSWPSVCLRPVVGVLLGMGVCVSASAAPILETYGTSLTSYKAGTTLIQGVRPTFAQRGVGLDGTVRAGPNFRWALAGNPSGDGWARQGFLGSLRMDTGAYAPVDVDLSLPAKMPWAVGRTYNALQDNSGHLDSNGYQGRNWAQTSQVEILFFDADGNSGTLQAADLVYLVYGADRYAEFKRTDLNHTTFKGQNGAAGVFLVTSGSPDVWTYYDQNGGQTSFFGFNTTSNATDGQIWKIVDPEGNSAYVGDSSSASTAISSGYTSGRISTVYDSSDRRYTYTYSTIDSVSRLTQVTCETKTGGAWASPSGLATVGQVDYAYYQTGDNAEGDNGCLKLVTITTPTSGGTPNLVSKKYYRYWKGTFNSSTNPGNPYQIKLVLGFEGCRKYDWDQDSNLDDDFLSASTSALQSYSDAYLEYTSGSDYRIAKGFFNGECGCSGGNNGTYEFTYGNASSYATYTGNTSYDNAWATRVVVKQPDAVYFTQYFDEVGQPLARVITASNPATSVATRWVTDVQRDSAGCVSLKDMPDRNDASSGYNHSTGAITAKTGTGSVLGLCMAVDRTGTPTGLDGFATGSTAQVLGTATGCDANPVYTSSTDWKSSQPALTVGTATVVRPVVEYTKAYVSAATSKNSGTYHTTQFTYTFWSATSTDPLVITPKKIVTTLPAVTTANNGSNSSNTTERYLNKDGTTAFTKAADGIFSYSEYNSHGQLTKSIQDPKSGSSETAMNTAANSSNFNITLPANGTHLVTTYTYDAQGRLETTTLPDGRVTKNFTTVLADGRIARLAVPRVDSGTTYYGPVSYTVANQAGQTEFSATLGIVGGSTTTAPSSWLNTSTADAMTAPLSGSGSFGSSNCTLSGISTTIYSSDGHKRLASRVYFANPSSLPGTSGTHYDETAYGYDDMGRSRRVLAPTGTIQRTVYDTLGRATERWIGTNDSSFAGGSASGTDTMVKTDASEYDLGSSGGNSLLTSRTLFVEASTTDQRVTSYKHDGRGRLVSTINPQAPHTVTTYDNLGRATSTAQYSSSSGLDGNSSTSTTTNRIAFMESAYDEVGRIYLSTRHKIAQSGGSAGTSLDSLTTNTWYDAAGRVIKVLGDGGISKTQYDRLGRAIKRFTISKVFDSAGTGAETLYADAADVAGDIVLEETISNYGNTDTSMSGKVMMSATIQRWHDDTTNKGDLDTNADTDDNLLTESNIKGRISIAVSFMDQLGRTTDTVAYGTNGMTGSGSANFDLTPSGSWLTAPTRSSTALRTSTVYEINGTVLTVESPGTPGSTTATTGIKTKYLYDDGHRKTAEVRNYLAGSTSTAARDNDLYTRYVYTNGLMTKMWVDLDGDNVVDDPAGTVDDDQVTEYTYGTTKGTGAGDSKVATGHLLQKVTYPDSSSGTDVVTFAYNAQSQQIWTKDQAGTILETDYDTAGRQTHRRATTIAGGLDTTIQRISTAYLSRGLVDTVTQYDNSSKTSGTAKDQVQYTYDDWGNLTKFEQDVDSTISGGSGRAAFSVQYAWTKRAVTNGTTTLVREVMTLPDGTTITSTFDDAQRVSKIDDPSVSLAAYEYLGAGQLVGTSLEEPNVFSNLYAAGSPHAYGNLDEFGRVKKSTWTNGISGGTDFYHVDLTYDNLGNIMRANDAIHADTSGNHRFDAVYSMDNLSRLTQAQEGHWGGSSLSPLRRDEQWKDVAGGGALKLSQTGNWLRRKLDLNGDGDFVDAGEIDDSGDFNRANEWLTRDTDSNASVNYTLVHDAAGNLNDDGFKYKYVYDAFGRMTSVTSRGGSPVTIEEFRYNGLGFRIGWHYDADGDNTLESGSPGDDPWYWFCYDERWRTIATYRYTDSDPKEQYVYHAAGARGLGGSSYIDSVVLRDRDADSGWRVLGDGDLEERRYYCQNWRADVSVILPSTGCDASSGPGILEWIKYSAYGTPQAFSMADYNRDGAVNSSDFNGTTGAFDVDYGASDLRADVNFDGGVTIDDYLLYINAAGEAAGRGTQSCASTANRIGYAGYVWDPVIGANHVRHRVYLPELGRWTRRDPLGYVDGMGLYQYALSKPSSSRDAIGLCSSTVGSVCASDYVTTMLDSTERCLIHPTGVRICTAPRCPQFLRGWLDDPRLQSTIDRIAQCYDDHPNPGGFDPMVWIDCANCENSETPTDPRAIPAMTLCGAGDNSTTRRGLIHELTHVAQRCEQWGAWYNTCNSAVDDEVEAYQSEETMYPLDPRIRDDGPARYCNNACDSAGAGGSSSGPCAAITMAACVAACEGRHPIRQVPGTPPPWRIYAGISRITTD